tara:strand:+ start:1022 stop:1375 length:354 start_codon:yes stop_codon:yes gene_type:complete
MLVCDICKQKFVSIYTLARHDNVFHNPDYVKPDPEQCPICKKFYVDLNQHFKRKHSSLEKHKEQIRRCKIKAQIYYKENQEKMKQTSREWHERKLNLSKCDNKTNIKVTYGEFQINF